jgi:predicted  nucleic acid-binding Zn-ribbon protein
VLESSRMHPAIKHLLEVQSVDLRIAELRTVLDAFPKRLKETEARLESAKQQLAASKEALANSLKERKKFELDVEQWKERARKYRDQGAAVKTNEAYRALLHEIAGAEAEVAKAEDRLLEQMVASEEFDRRVKSAEAALKLAEQETHAERQQIEAERAAVQKKMDEAQAERERAIAPVPEEMRTLYARVAKRHSGVALAETRNEMCLACGMRVVPHVYQELARDSNEEIFTCATCGRILYVAAGASATADKSATSDDPAASAASQARGSGQG